MIGTQSQPSATTQIPPLSHETNASLHPEILSSHTHTSTLQLSTRAIRHNPKAGLNPLVDAASFLFSVIGELKHSAQSRQLHLLHQELVQEINTFQDTIEHHGYNAEYVIICRYVLCATL